MITTVMLLAVAALRDVIISEGVEVPFGLPQALLLFGILGLFALLVGVVVWRVRRTSRSK